MAQSILKPELPRSDRVEVAEGVRRILRSPGSETFRGRVPMVTDFEVLRAMVEATLEKPNFGRVTSLLGIASLWAPFQTLTRLSLSLDDRVHPQYREAKLEAPIFIIANPRSGTTLLHRLMSEDEENFASFTLGETIFPSVTVQKLFERIGELDQEKLGGRLLKAVKAFDAAVFGSRWEGVHRLGLFETEEDETFFTYSLQSPTVMLLSPFPAAFASLVNLDKQPRETRDRMMDYYEGLLRRLMYRKGEQKRYLDKNVFHTTRIRTISERFPDARFVYLVRHPYEALPSFLNMFYAAWRTHSRDIPRDSKEMRELLGLGLDNYRYALGLSRFMPKDRYTVLRYEDLVADPKGFVESLYKWLDMEMSPAFRERLEQATSAQRTYERPYDHKLSDYGISEEAIAEELAEVFQAFNYKP